MNYISEAAEYGENIYLVVRKNRTTEILISEVKMDNILAEIDKLQKEINSFKPFSEHLLKQLKEYFRIGLTYSSNALEGNSLTETETKVVLEDGLTIGGKPLRDHYEAMGHSEAYSRLYDLAKNNKITEKDVLELHRLFYNRIDEKKAGKYRAERVIITGSRYKLPNPEEVPELMAKFVSRLEILEGKEHPVIYSSLAHKEFVFVHPFIDGNGRVARLLMNLVLLQKGYCIAVIPPVLRSEYIRTLEKAHTDDKEFKQFIAERVMETQKDYLRLLK